MTENSSSPSSPKTADITDWRSIVTLVVFVITNAIVLFPFHVPLYIPRWLSNAFIDAAASCRIIGPRHKNQSGENADARSSWVRLSLPLNIVTAPLIADLFLLAILAIGREEVKGGTLGADHIEPLDIMIFFITLAYIAISIDASGLIRYLAFKVLSWGGKYGHRLFFYLYVFFFGLGTFVGNDPIILSGTAFLAYMTRVSSNIVHPRAWIYTQFAVANISSAILVSSNPTNLVLAGAFGIKFIEYTAHMIVPVIATAIVLFPFLLYIVFASPKLIPISIDMRTLPEEAKQRKPVNPNIPHARGTAEQEEDSQSEQGKLLSLEEIMNPFLDKRGAAFGGIIMAVTLITILAINAARSSIGAVQVYWITLPAAVAVLIWDISFGWLHRHETREIARKGREQLELARLEKERNDLAAGGNPVEGAGTNSEVEVPESQSSVTDKEKDAGVVASTTTTTPNMNRQNRTTLASRARDAYRWSQETFPTATAVLSHLPYALVPFAFSMFVLVQALKTKGWVEVFARGWDRWVAKTGTVGAIGGMGFLSVILCNFSGTNIGTTILLCRVIQEWREMYRLGKTVEVITDRTFWATVYSMAVGVNYGAFSTALSASLAGLLWRDILAKKHIHVRRLDFARVNMPIIAIAMTVGCAVLIGEMYVIKKDVPYVPPPLSTES